MNSHLVTTFLGSGSPMPNLNMRDPTFYYSPSWLRMEGLTSYFYSGVAASFLPVVRLNDFFATSCLAGSGTALKTTSCNTGSSWLFPFLRLQHTFASSHVADRDAAFNSIQSMSSLEDNWDGYGAVGIPAETISLALGIIVSLPDHVPAPEVSANPNGTISFEWENEVGRAHLEIGRTKYSLYFRPMARGTLYQDGLVAEIDDSMRNLLDEMFPLVSPQDYTISDIRLAKAA
ncbi:MAG: hypothetical protein ACLPV8_01245 [Steroidobacteraceae bacterium]